MSENIHTLDFNSKNIYENAAHLLSVLACPKNDPIRRQTFFENLCYQAVQHIAKSQDDFQQNLRFSSSQGMIAPRNIKRNANTINRQLNYRLQAAHIAIGFLQIADVGKHNLLPEGINKLTVNKMAGVIGRGDETNVKHRIWKPSLPVIHLASALAVNIRNSEIDGSLKSGLGDILFDRRSIEAVVIEAQRFEELVDKSQIKINASDLIKFRITE